MGAPIYHNNIMDTLKIHLCPSHIGQLLLSAVGRLPGGRLPGAVSPDVLHNASLQIILTVQEVVDTENWLTSNLPFLLDPNSIAKMQSQSLVTDSPLLLLSLLLIVVHLNKLQYMC